MKKYSYKALKEKKFVTGELEGKDEEEIVAKLKGKGMEVLSVTSKSDKVKDEETPSKKSFLQRFEKVKKVDKVFLYKNFSTMLKAGLPLPESIDLLRGSLKTQKLVDILGQLKYDVEAGGTISGSLSKHPDVFGTSEVAMIRAGEIGGTLPQSFLGLYEDEEAEHQLQKDIKSAMMYPMMILAILFLVTMLMFLFVLPQLTSFFDQANIEVPTITKIIMQVSKFSKKYFILILITFVSLIILLRVSIKRSKEAKKTFDKLLIKIPMIGTQLRSFYVYRFARMLGLLTRSGVPILQALDIVKSSLTHSLYINSVKVMKEDVKLGGNLYSSIEKFEDIYPPFVSRMLKVGDRTGNTAEALKNISEYYKESLEETLANLSSLIEPILMVFLGGGVAFIAVSVLIPLYKIVSGINQMQK